MYRDPGLSSELSENGGPCTSTVSCRAPPHLQQVGRELGIPAGPPLPGQGAGHPRRTVSTWSGSWASQEDRLYPVRELGIPGGLHLPGRRGQWLGGRCWDVLTQGQAGVCLRTLGLPANLSLGISLVRACQVLLDFQSD